MDVEKVKPKLRGVFHALGFFAALGGLPFLAMSPLEGAQYTAGLVYGASLCLLLGLSALYHRPMWRPRVRAVLKRLDHSGIYVLIAGTYTPMAVLDAHGALAWNLWLMWAAALSGMVVSTVWQAMPRWLKAANYVVLGCSAAPLVFRLLALLGPVRFGLLLTGSALYAVGALVYARRWPNPRPAVFGYHEVFHVLVLAAAGLQFAVMLDVQYAPALGA